MQQRKDAEGEYKYTIHASAYCAACIRARLQNHPRCTTDAVDDAGERYMYGDMAHLLMQSNRCNARERVRTDEGGWTYK